jgi:hypothetical protein
MTQPFNIARPADGDDGMPSQQSLRPGKHTAADPSSFLLIDITTETVDLLQGPFMAPPLIRPSIRELSEDPGSA